MNDSTTPCSEEQEVDTTPAKARSRRLSSRIMMLARRTHLYAGLFLLPWVFLYGITGAMFNHQLLFPQVEYLPVADDVIMSSGLSSFPELSDFAQQVVSAINESDSSANVSMAGDPHAELTNALMFETHVDNAKYIVHVDPVNSRSYIVKQPENDSQPARISDVRNVRLQSDPVNVARAAASHALKGSGINADHLQPFGWTKLNFLAEVDGKPARITYVLKDGHVDIMEYSGVHGMTPRGFFLRLHTGHGQSPHWNGRSWWSLFVDAMAIAMVTWGLTGLLMWWQIKRTRLIGSVVILTSLGVAMTMYLVMQDFYATTML